MFRASKKGYTVGEVSRVEGDDWEMAPWTTPCLPYSGADLVRGSILRRVEAGRARDCRIRQGTPHPVRYRSLSPTVVLPYPSTRKLQYPHTSTPLDYGYWIRLST